jgi:phage terminase large subunit-like protein
LDRLEEIAAKRARLAQRQAERAAAVPLLNFSVKRRPSQAPFFSDTHKVCGLFSGNQAGKDYCLDARTAILYCRGKILPREMPNAFEPFRKMVAIQQGRPLAARYYVPVLDTWEKVIVPNLLMMIPAELRDGSRSSDGSGYNRSDQTLWLKDASWIKGLSYEGFRQDEQKAEGVRLDMVGFSEVPPEALYDQAYSRTLQTNGMVWIAATRNAKTCPYPMGWIRSRIIRKGDGKHVQHYMLSTRENAYATAEEIGGEAGAELIRNFEATVAALSPEDRAAQIDGEWSGEGGVVFKSFNDDDHLYDIPGVTPELFVDLAKQGWGEIVAGFDHSGSGVTYVPYLYHAFKPIEELRLAPQDWITISEYSRADARCIDNLPALQENQRRFKPTDYFCDPSMWSDTAGMCGFAPAVLYSDPSRLLGLVRAKEPDAFLEDMTPIGPLRKACNAPGSVDMGVQIISAMLLKRVGKYPWPRFRLLKGYTPHAKRGFEEFFRNSDTVLANGGAKYSPHCKDQIDAHRYPLAAFAGQESEVEATPSIYVPRQYGTGMAVSDFVAPVGVPWS